MEDGFDFAGGFVHHREIVAVDFHGDIGADAGDEFVETHLDGLRELVVVAGDFLRGGFHGGDEVGFGAERIGPLRARFQHDVGVGDARGHGVGGHFGRAHFGDDAVHLGELFQAVLEFALHGDGLGEAGAGDAEGVHGDVALVEAGDEFGAEARGGEPGEADEHDGGERDGGTDRHDEAERRAVEGFRAADGEVILFGDFAGDENRDGGGDEGDGEEHRAEEGGDDGEGHRVKHFSLDAGEGEDGHVDDGDDEFAEERGGADLLGGVEDEGEALLFGEQAAETVLFLAETAEAVFDDNDGTVHDEAEVERTEAHEITGDFIGHHAGDREKHGKRDDGSGDECGAEISEEEKEDHDHEHRALDEVVADGGDGAVHERGAVVNGGGDNAGREAAVNVDEFFSDAGGDLAGVFADEHEDGAEDDLAAVFGGGAGAEFLAEEDLGDIAHADGLAAALGDDEGADFSEGGDLAGDADEVLFAGALDVAGADICVVAGERLHDVAEREAVGDEAVGVRGDVKLFHEAADGVDLGDALEITELRAHDPVLELAEIGGGVGGAVGFAGGGGFRLDGEHENLAEAGGEGAHRGIEAGRELCTQRLETLGDELAGEVNVRAVFEDDGDLGETVAGEGARVVEFGQAGHRGLDGEGHALFGFERRVAGGLGVDLDLDVGDVGDGVDGQALKVDYAERGDAEGGEQHQPTVADGELEKIFEHGE